MAKNQWEGGVDVELPAQWQGGMDVPLNEIVNDPRAAGLSVPPEIPAEVVPTSWLEAAFPRTARAQGAGATALGLGLDVLSPGRFVAALARPEGESYRDAVARTGPPEVLAQPGDRLGSEWSDRLAETIMRGPETIPLTALTAVTGGATVAPWLARLGWGTRAAIQGAGAGGTIAATRQAENVAAGRDLSGMETAADVGTGVGLGVLTGGLANYTPALRSMAGRYLTTVIDPTDKARRAGWSGVQALQELSREGRFLPLTLSGLKQRAEQGMARRIGAREAAIAADEAAAQAAGVPARVDLGKVRDEAFDAVAENMAARRNFGSVGATEGAQNWLAREMQAQGLGPHYVPVRDALAVRQGLDDFAFVENAKNVTAARQNLTLPARREINRQLDIVAPRTRAADAEIAKLASQGEGLGVVLERRQNRDPFTTTDAIAAAVAAQAAGGGGPGLAAGGLYALGQRILRTPAPATAMYMASSPAVTAVGRGGTILGAPVIGTALLRQPTDNTRGGRR